MYQSDKRPQAEWRPFCATGGPKLRLLILGEIVALYGSGARWLFTGLLLVGWLIGWLVGRLVAKLLVAWSVDRVVGCLVGGRLVA